MATELGTPIVPVTFDPPEKSRTYTYPDGQKFTFKDVTELVVRPSGNHRIKTADGYLHIIAAGWRTISMKTKEWTI